MVTAKKSPKKKLPTGPTKADLLSRMGVNREPEPIVPPPAQKPPHLRVAAVEPVEPLAPAAVLSSKPPQESVLAIAAAPPEDPPPESVPHPVEIERSTASAVPSPVGQAELVRPAKLPSVCTDNANGNGLCRNDKVAPLPGSPMLDPVASLADPRQALDAELGLQELTLKCSVHTIEKLGSLQTSTGLPGEILVEVLLDHWEQLPKPVQQDCLLQAHRIRVERLVISQNHTIATIEQLLNEQHLL
ncbi:MAG: hypothetical protein Q6K80_01460 [Thermostichus sp. DG_1_6_bins_120]